MSSFVLTPGEIQELVRLLRDVFAAHAKVRESSSLGTLIQFPKIPSVLSESIAFHLLKGGILLGAGAHIGLSSSGGRFGTEDG